MNLEEILRARRCTDEITTHSFVAILIFRAGGRRTGRARSSCRCTEILGIGCGTCAALLTDSTKVSTVTTWALITSNALNLKIRSTHRNIAAHFSSVVASRKEGRSDTAPGVIDMTGTLTRLASRAVIEYVDAR